MLSTFLIEVLFYMHPQLYTHVHNRKPASIRWCDWEKQRIVGNYIIIIIQSITACSYFYTTAVETGFVEYLHEIND